jgi:hypothetical protein
MKLTDTQLVLLSAASQREDRAIVAPNLKGSAAHKVVGKLLTEGLIEEVPAGGALPVWRRNDEEGALALRITRRGLAAIRVDEDGAPPDAQEAREAKRGPDRAPGKSNEAGRKTRKLPIRDSGSQRPHWLAGHVRFEPGNVILENAPLKCRTDLARFRNILGTRDFSRTSCKTLTCTFG